MPSKCRVCGQDFDVKEVIRVYGEVPTIHGCCSAQCYTQLLLKNEERDIPLVIKDLVEMIKTCSVCDGTGINPRDETSACNRCGGQGETLDATGLISDIRSIHKRIRDGLSK